MFCDPFLRDLQRARTQVVIESPFVTSKRIATLLLGLKRLSTKGIHVVINTKPIEEHMPLYQDYVIWVIGVLQTVGVKVPMTGGHHRKLAIIDDDILWEGSLNVLS